jgi:hypothetical protein
MMRRTQRAVVLATDGWATAEPVQAELARLADPVQAAVLMRFFKTGRASTPRAIGSAG